MVSGPDSARIYNRAAISDAGPYVIAAESYGTAGISELEPQGGGLLRSGAELYGDVALYDDVRPSSGIGTYGIAVGFSSDTVGVYDSIEFSDAESSCPVSPTPTNSSYYSFNGTPTENTSLKSQTWMYARDAKSQQRGVPASQARPYPSPFSNGEDLPLKTPGSNLRPGHGPEWLHYPLIPGQSTTWKPRNGVSPGSVRSFYTKSNTNTFDVGYHNLSAGTTAKGHGQFTLANYHAARLKPSAAVEPVKRSNPEQLRVGTAKPHPNQNIQYWP